MADNHNHQWKPCRCSYAECTRGTCGTCHAVLLPAEEHIADLGMMCDTARHEHNPEYREFHRSICLECNQKRP